MIIPWALPRSRLFLVAYEGGDGKPYALAVSNLDLAEKLARKFSGESIDTIVDAHADMAQDDQPRALNDGPNIP